MKRDLVWDTITTKVPELKGLIQKIFDALKEQEGR